ELVGVGIEPQRVARVPVARVQGEFVGPRLVIHERQARLRERLPHVELPVDRQGRGAAGVQAVCVYVIRAEIELLAAILGAEGDVQAARRARQLRAVLAEVTRDRGVGDVYLG